MTVKHTLKQCLYGGVLVVLAVCVSACAVFWTALSPYREARARATQVAKNIAGMQSVESFKIVTIEKTYYSVSGVSADGKKLLALIPEDPGDVLVYEANQGVSADDSLAIAEQQGAKKVQKTALGLLKGKPVWEVSTAEAYYYIDFKTGEFISKEEL